jgi:hypothetical protein
MGFSPLGSYKQEIVNEVLVTNETSILAPAIATLPTETIVAIVVPVIVVCIIGVVLIYIFAKPKTLG